MVARSVATGLEESEATLDSALEAVAAEDEAAAAEGAGESLREDGAVTAVEEGASVSLTALTAAECTEISALVAAETASLAASGFLAPPMEILTGLRGASLLSAVVAAGLAPPPMEMLTGFRGASEAAGAAGLAPPPIEMLTGFREATSEVAAAG